MKTIALILLALATSGCATCREYPTACKAVAAVAIAGAIIAIDRHNENHAHGLDRDPRGPECRPTPAGPTCP